jgi:hypothetical protein
MSLVEVARGEACGELRLGCAWVGVLCSRAVKPCYGLRLACGWCGADVVSKRD